MSGAIFGEITLGNTREFSVVTDANRVTTIKTRDGDLFLGLNLTDDAATDLANAIRRSITLPGERVTSAEMQKMRARGTL